ncbi:MAG: hypothetical protein LBT97_13895 [Planctomycetota bacterium]|jgi:hypothetical protein|nr:hypothetical protein [Planctomycetota bacterium]
MRIYSTGEAAAKLGVSRDSLLTAIMRSGAPDAGQRCGGRRYFSEDDIEKLVRWYGKHRTKRQAAGDGCRNERIDDGDSA